MRNQSISLFSLFSSIPYLFLVLNCYGGLIVNGDIDISNLCKNVTRVDPTENYEFCVSALEANPLSKTSDIFGLGVISIELCSSNATYTHTYIDGILKDGKPEPERVRACLQDCIEFYSTALEEVQAAMKAFKGKDYETAGSQLYDALIDTDTCKIGFTELGVDFPLKKHDYDFFQLIGISLSIIKIILG
ncbi:hypothetical protein MKW94_023356 [Papaver nudicaule]|uniref:Pectinesterase inhibitor domain-containing protein n=1 Tax=Papaver nudicaule TaxID=74823 RepID=A0AA41VC77_PAPNU|nr:hypothetical protein [Papaver nudicaule]